MPRVNNTCELIETSLRRAMLPSNDSTYDCCDVIDILNEELDSYLIPIILKHHEEYLVHEEDSCIIPCIIHYQIPYRAVGNKLRDMYYVDTSDNHHEATRVSIEDRNEFGCGYVSRISNVPFYPQNDEIVLMKKDLTNGKLRMLYYLRPNLLVKVNKTAKITDTGAPFGCVQITCFSNLICGTADKLTIAGVVFTAQPTASTLGEKTFTAASSNNATALSLITQINAQTTTSSLVTATICPDCNTNVVITSDCSCYDLSDFNYTSNCSIGLTITNIKRKFTLNNAPSAFTCECCFDIIQGKTPNKIITFDIPKENYFVCSCGCICPTITFLHSDLKRLNIYCSSNPTVIPFSVGDYVTVKGETPFPQIPPELRSILSQLAAIHMLDGLGDVSGVERLEKRLRKMEENLGILIDNRVEGAPQKVVNKKGFLYQRRSSRRL